MSFELGWRLRLWHHRKEPGGQAAHLVPMAKRQKYNGSYRSISPLVCKQDKSLVAPILFTDILSHTTF